MMSAEEAEASVRAAEEAATRAARGLKCAPYAMAEAARRAADAMALVREVQSGDDKADADTVECRDDKADADMVPSRDGDADADMVPSRDGDADADAAPSRGDADAGGQSSEEESDSDSSDDQNRDEAYVQDVNPEREKPDLTSVTLNWEPVNMVLVEKALRLDAMRRATNDRYDYFEILVSISLRATRVRRGVGYIAVATRASKGVGQFDGRLHSGIAGLKPEEVPKAIRAELAKGVPEELAGLSVFAFCKSIRYLCRSGLGISEYDLFNAFYSVMCELMDVPEPIRTYRDSKETIMQSVQAYFEEQTSDNIKLDDVKTLFISLGFGGSVYGWMKEHLKEPIALDGACGEFLESFEDAARTLHRMVADRYPEELNLLNDKPNPAASLTFHVYAHNERKHLTSMMQAADRKGKVVSPEHDGVSAQGPEDEMLRALSEAVHPLQVAIKRYPEDPFEKFRTDFPYFDWTLETDADLKDYMTILRKCREHIKKGPTVVKANNHTFAKYVAMQLRAVTNVTAADGEKRSHFEMFNAGGFWITKHRDDLTAITLSALSRLSQQRKRKLRTS